jgi:hypothetical protein
MGKTGESQSISRWEGIMRVLFIASSYYPHIGDVGYSIKLFAGNSYGIKSWLWCERLSW